MIRENFSDTTIVIPTLNEEKNIGILIEKLKALYPKVKIIVTDDGSTDRTREIANTKGAIVVDRTEKKIKGITAAVLDAAKLASTEKMIVMDADFQHPPAKVGEIVEQLKENEIVIAVRRKVLGHWGMIRKMESKIGTILAQLRLRKRIKDPLSGFFGIRTKTMQNTDKSRFELRCFKILFNILKNSGQGTKIGYVWYDFNMRLRGESKISKKHIYYFVKNLLK